MTSADHRRPELTPETVEGVRRRDPDAVVEAYRALAPSVHGFLVRQVGDPQWAQDLTAQTFLEVVEAADRFEGTPTGFRSWVFRIARNTMVDHFRRESRRTHPSLEEAQETGRLPASPHDTERDATSNVERDRLLRLVDELSPDQREVVLLRIVADLSIAEVARITGKTQGAVKALQHRAIRALAERLPEEGS